MYVVYIFLHKYIIGEILSQPNTDMGEQQFYIYVGISILYLAIVQCTSCKCHFFMNTFTVFCNEYHAFNYHSRFVV